MPLRFGAEVQEMPRRLTAPAGAPDLAVLRAALGALQHDTPRNWGTLDAAAMAEHCARFVDVYAGRIPVSPVVALVARWIGRPFLRRLLATPPERAARGMATAPAMRVTGRQDFATARKRLEAALDEAAGWKGPKQHPMYGPMDGEEMQILVAHHTAHHFRQFGLI